MDHALFQSNIIQNVLFELRTLGATADRNSAVCGSDKVEPDGDLLERFAKTIWVSPSQWLQLISFLEAMNEVILENWDRIPDSDKDGLVSLSKSILSCTPVPKSISGSNKEWNLLSFLRPKLLTFSLKYASFVLGEDLSVRILEVIDDCSRDVLERAGIIPGVDASRTLVLSNEARDAFLRDIEDPPEPPEALVSGMKEFWEQFK